MTAMPAPADMPPHTPAPDDPLADLPRLSVPGLLVTGTDTEVGKTVITCALAALLRRRNPDVRLGVCKPFSTGCRREREGLVNADAEALAHFADCRLPLTTINPIRYQPPLAPAAAAEQVNQPIDWPALARSLTTLDQHSDTLLIEGVGGLLVPLDPHRPQLTLLDFAAALDYPVLVVARAGLGTLNHTAMTVRLLNHANLRVAGIVINNYDPDNHENDPSIQQNQHWLERLTGAPVLAVTPRVDKQAARVDQAQLDPRIIDALAMCNWNELLAQPRQQTR